MEASAPAPQTTSRHFTRAWIFGVLSVASPFLVPVSLQLLDRVFAGGPFHFWSAVGVAVIVCVLGIANAGVALVNDYQNGYFNKILLAPVSMWAILLGRLISDGLRIYIQGGVMLGLAFFFDAEPATGIPGALLMLAIASLFAIFSVGIIVANVALKTKDAQAVQAIFPLFFILIFLTTAFMPEQSIGNEVVCSIIQVNPAEYIVRAMHSLMFTGYDAQDIGMAFAVIGGFAIVGMVVTRLNYRSVYK